MFAIRRSSNAINGCSLKSLWNFTTFYNSNTNRELDKSYEDAYDAGKDCASIHVDASIRSKVGFMAAVVRSWDSSVMLYVHKKDPKVTDNHQGERGAGKLGLDLAADVGFLIFELFTDYKRSVSWLKHLLSNPSTDQLLRSTVKYLQSVRPKVSVHHTFARYNGLADSLTQKNLDMNWLSKQHSDSQSIDLFIRNNFMKEGTSRYMRHLRSPSYEQQDLLILKEIKGGYIVLHQPTKMFYRQWLIESEFDIDLICGLQTSLERDWGIKSSNLLSCAGFVCDSKAFSILLETTLGTLEDLLKVTGVLQENRIASICKQVLTGLAALESGGCFYCDLQPSTLYFCDRYMVKIGVFGVAALLNKSRRVLMGSPEIDPYMSPERLLGEKYDSTSHLWSLGMIALECAIGKYPHTPAQSYLDLVRVATTSPPPAAPSSVFSPEFCSFIASCLQIEARDRGQLADMLVHPFVRYH